MSLEMVKDITDIQEKSQGLGAAEEPSVSTGGPSPGVVTSDLSDQNKQLQQMLVKQNEQLTAMGGKVTERPNDRATKRPND